MQKLKRVVLSIIVLVLLYSDSEYELELYP